MENIEIDQHIKNLWNRLFTPYVIPEEENKFKIYQLNFLVDYMGEKCLKSINLIERFFNSYLNYNKFPIDERKKNGSYSDEFMTASQEFYHDKEILLAYIDRSKELFGDPDTWGQSLKDLFPDKNQKEQIDFISTNISFVYLNSIVLSFSSKDLR